MPRITSIAGRILYNSRGSKTIEVDVISDEKYLGRVGPHQVQVLENMKHRVFLRINLKKVSTFYKKIKKNSLD